MNMYVLINTAARIRCNMSYTVRFMIKIKYFYNNDK